MKVPRSISLLLLLWFTTACQTWHPCDDEVVCETYIHRYGVPLEPQDWSDRGQDGQVVAMRKDGVTVTHSYDGGILHGECSHSFPYREAIQKKDIYDQGRLVQKVDYYYSGFPRQQIIHESPTEYSLSNWYESGAPQCCERYENEHLVHGEYYQPTSEIETRVEEANGSRTRRDGQGKLLSVDGIHNGQMVVRTTYHPNGAPASVSPYVNRVVEGQRRTFLSGGEPATIEEWKNNVQHGKTIVFDHGDKSAEVPYVNGNKHGMERRYNEDQTLVQEVTWVQGKQQGPSRTYAGNTTTVDWYFDDRQVHKQTYDVLVNQ